MRGDEGWAARPNPSSAPLCKACRGEPGSQFVRRRRARNDLKLSVGHETVGVNFVRFWVLLSQA